MNIAVIEMRAKLLDCRSLKDKRTITKGMIAELRRIFYASVAETGLQDIVQHVQLTVAVVCSDHGGAQKIANAIVDYFYQKIELQSVDCNVEMI